MAPSIGRKKPLCAGAMSSTMLPHRPSGYALDAGEQFSLPGSPTAAFVVYPLKEVADRHFAPLRVRLVDHPHLTGERGVRSEQRKHRRMRRLI
jgi:hypothetical protein